MIWSVSTLLRRSGTPIPVWVVKASITEPISTCWFPRTATTRSTGRVDMGSSQVLRARQGPADGRCGRDQRGDQVGAAALALAALEVAVRRRRAALARGQLVRVHPQAHRASRRAPLGPGVEEDLVEALVL